MKRGYFCTVTNNGWRYMLASVLWPKLESAPNTVDKKAAVGSPVLYERRESGERVRGARAASLHILTV